jgi:hypothetical protein
MQNSEENIVEADARRKGATREVDLFKTTKRNLTNTRQTVSVLNSGIRHKRDNQDVEIALSDKVDSAQQNLENALTLLPGGYEGRLEVPFTDPEEVDRYLDIAEREFREALEYLDKQAREEGLHELEGQKHHFHGKHLSVNSEDYLDAEDYGLFEVVDKALGIDLAPENSNRAYVCDVENLGESVTETFYDNQGQLDAARSCLPDSGYRGSHLETHESIDTNP